MNFNEDESQGARRVTSDATANASDASDANSLDTQWMSAITEAERRARQSGRGDVLEYLRLRANNDEARRVGISWLFQIFEQHAGMLVRAGAGVQLAQDVAHRFQSGGATMVGQRIVFKLGVRTLTVEAGFPRTPQDGFVRGGGLAAARLTHFGRASLDTDLLLKRLSQNPQDAPGWFVLDAETGSARQTFVEADAQRHLAQLIS